MERLQLNARLPSRETVLTFLAVHSVDDATLQCAFLVTYIVFFAPKDAWCGWSSAIFQDLGPNIRLGIAGIVSVCSEWAAWDLVSIASSYLSPIEFAVNQVASEWDGLMERRRDGESCAVS